MAVQAWIRVQSMGQKPGGRFLGGLPGCLIVFVFHRCGHRSLNSILTGPAGPEQPAMAAFILPAAWLRASVHIWSRSA